jgi:3-hydroxy-9,10-secoandrosta-1,3,5(10)-triene-9,17-dione monooxygenase
VLTIGAWFSEAGQRDIFGSSGEFSAPHRALPSGTAEPADGGYVVTGTWDYCSGSAYATHFMCNAMVAGTTERITAVMPMDQVTVLDDWGDGATLGMNASGSNSVRVEGVFVPARRTAPADWTHGEAMAPGAALHGPLYCGRIYALYHAGLVIPVIGAARAALDEYEQIIKSKMTYFPPRGHVPRAHRLAVPDHRGRAGPGALRPAGLSLLTRLS